MIPASQFAMILSFSTCILPPPSSTVVTLVVLTFVPFGFPFGLIPFPLPFAFAKETWFFMRSATKFIREDSTSESLKINAQAKCDDAMREALTDPEQGILKAGLLPHVDTAVPAGAKQLLGAMTQAHMWDVGMAGWGLNHTIFYIYPNIQLPV